MDKDIFLLYVDLAARKKYLRDLFSALRLEKGTEKRKLKLCRFLNYGNSAQ